MSLKERIDADIKHAMRTQQKDELRALRAIKSLILLSESEKGKAGELNEEVEMNLLMKAAKQRKDSLRIYEEQGRDDLAGKEREELSIIERYLPKQLSDEEITTAVNEIIQHTGAAGMKDMGKVMGLATQQLAGKADGKRIAEITRKMLS